jgi:hypothetical protein
MLQSEAVGQTISPAALEAERRVMMRRIGALSALVERRQVELEAAETEKKRLIAALSECEQRYDAIRSSTFWRATGPFRALVGQLRRMRRIVRR